MSGRVLRGTRRYTRVSTWTCTSFPGGSFGALKPVILDEQGLGCQITRRDSLFVTSFAGFGRRLGVLSSSTTSNPFAFPHCGVHVELSREPN